jgi:ABC-type polysaccharide/polyol phosphate export permease
MIAVAVLNICFGVLVILMGLFLALGVMALLYEQSRLGVFELPVARTAFAVLVLVTGIIGLVAGIGIFSLRPSARALSLAFAVLLIVCCALSFFLVPIIGSIGTYDLRTIDAFNLVRLAAFSAIFIAIPVIYAPILCIAFNKRAWKTVFAEGPA